MKNSTTRPGPFKTILWAIDPLSGDEELETHAASIVRTLSKALDCAVEPVYVMRPDILDRPTPLYDAGDIRSQVEWHLKHFMARHEELGLRPARLLTANGSSVTKAVEAVSTYVQASGASLVVLSTQSRKGLPRLFQRSFAESLLLSCPVPVIVANAKAKRVRALKKILFPTDFSKESREAFNITAALAKKLQARITLIHRADYLLPPVEYPFLLPPLHNEAVISLETEHRAKANEWIAYGKSHGVTVNYRLIMEPLDLPGEISRLAEKSPSTFIALASQSGPIASAIMGSIPRAVIRTATCPVMVYHPKKAAKGQTHPEKAAKAI